ncbi:MAG: ATP-binding cassette domain-containing protein [bacterium]|nr:ATP-binding cassette domain-containing protein [bacterium]
MNPLSLPIRRPVATSMFFLGLVLLGLIGWRQIPVELMPDLTGDELTVNFGRLGSEPEVVEREILLPLEGRVAELAMVAESWGEVQGSRGSFRVRFERGADLKVQELELQQIAAELAHGQPRGTFVEVQPQFLSIISRFVMVIRVTGGGDHHALHDLVEERIAPRLAAVPEVRQVLTGGSAGRGVTVRVDPDRCAAMGVTPMQVTAALSRAVDRLRFLGGIEDEAGRTALVLDGRPRGVVSLANTRVAPERPVLLRHVAEVDIGTGREQLLFRLNGQPSVALIVFQDHGANLVRLGRALRRRLDNLRDEFQPLGIDFVMSFDAAEVVENQIDRLKRLGASGFLIALVVLYLFLRRLRAVAVVAVAVPVSLLVGFALLFICGRSLNLITLFGLAVGIGLLVDNSVVVYEAVQRRLERGADPDAAAVEGVRRTVRAIVAASLTTAIVFLPLTLIDFSMGWIRSLAEIVALAILLPLAGSLLVAVGLVPLLARRLAAPAAIRRLADERRRRRELGGLTPPDRVRTLFSGLLTAALRRPAGWIAGVVTAVLITVLVALPWVSVNTVSQEPTVADEVRLTVRFTTDQPLPAATGVFARLEEAVRALQGIDRVESMVQEDGGSLTIHLVDEAERPSELSVARVRGVVREEAEKLQGVDVLRPGEGESGARGGGEGGGGMGDLLGQRPAEVVLSGPDNRQLNNLAREIRDRLDSIPEVRQAWLASRAGREEVRVIPDAYALAAFGLTADQMLPVLRGLGREGIEMQTGFTLESGRELPLVVRREEEGKRALADLGRLRLATPAGVLPLAAVAAVRKMPAPPVISHHNGRREMTVRYRMAPNVPATGPARLALEERIAAVVRESYRPEGYTVEARSQEEGTNLFRALLGPAILLLFLVLAMTFESPTMPVLVLLALPLTILGAVWALALAGMPLDDPMARCGGPALVGQSVSPASLHVDRRQQRFLAGGRSAGAAALAAVRERARPVLMTTATTVAGLWPLALVTGRDNEIWPPFATIVIGGLLTSTLLTLLVIPVGFVILQRLDRLFGRLGPWVMIGWLALTAAVMVPLVAGDLITTLRWQVITTLLVAGVLLGLAVLLLWRRRPPEPAAADGPPAVEVRYLRKIYGLPGPVGRAWRAPEIFARRVLERGGRAFDPRQARDRLLALALVALGLGWLALFFQTFIWRLLFLLAAAVLASRAVLEIRRARGKADAVGRVVPGGPEGFVAVLLPWLALLFLAYRSYLEPKLAGAPASGGALFLICVVALLVALVQLGRRTARRLAWEGLPERVAEGTLRRVRTSWRWLSRRLFGLDLPREQVRALVGVHFRAERGMVGILGPNGAGKTTLLRQLAGILEPTRGRITLGGVPLERIRRYLGRWVGYLPQDAALPAKLTAREYLDYYALLYEIPAAERAARVASLLEEVGLAGRADERIGSYSGGMRQRVAVARTLLRLPPVIIVDEPTVGLDPRERIRFRNLLSRLARGRVVLFSTHVVEDVAVACERVIVLARGQLVFDGPPAELVVGARGKVWEVSLTAEERGRLPASAQIADQVPEAEARSRLRVLCVDSPHPQARTVEPTLEEGYLMLVGERAV